MLAGNATFVEGGELAIVKPIGQGGMGTVYEAVQRATGAQRAVKVMRSGLATDPRFRARFDKEARVSTRIPSDHVVQVVGAGVDGVGVVHRDLKPEVSNRSVL